MEAVIQEALSKGVEMHVAGEFDLASQLYGSVIKLDPDHADANHNMGLLKVDTGRCSGGIAVFADRTAGRHKRSSVLAQLY